MSRGQVFYLVLRYDVVCPDYFYTLIPTWISNYIHYKVYSINHFTIPKLIGVQKSWLASALKRKYKRSIKYCSFSYTTERRLLVNYVFIPRHPLHLTAQILMQVGMERMVQEDYLPNIHPMQYIP